MDENACFMFSIPIWHCFFFHADITECLYLIFLYFIKFKIDNYNFHISCLLVKNSNFTIVFKQWNVSIELILAVNKF